VKSPKSLSESPLSDVVKAILKSALSCYLELDILFKNKVHEGENKQVLYSTTVGN
jgi:hypothetical protein